MQFKISIGLILFFFQFQILAQDINYNFSSIPPELLKKTNAVIRLDETKVNLLSDKNMEITQKQVVTVLNKNGNRVLNTRVYYDPTIKVKKLEAKVYDAFGKQIRKYKKNDFTDASAVSDFSLYEDNRVKYLSYTPITYPYTVEIIKVIESSNTAFMPRWIPISGYWVSTEKSSYTLINSTNIPYRIKKKNFEGYSIEEIEHPNSLVYTLKNVKSIPWEELSPPFYKINPMLLISLDVFHLKGVDGHANNWKTLGKWQYDKLLVGRDELPQNTVDEVTKLVAGITDKREKAKRIYEYMQDNTRYISVQLGIGGWQPIKANEVDEVKYGDCKGLTNYTKALLKSQGIDSYYSVVWAGDNKRSFEEDFAVMEGNHVILNIPNGDENIWLECTSQTLPFGYIGNATDDRNVLVVKPSGGEVVKTKSYLNEDNYQKTIANYNIDETGAIEGEISIKTQGSQFYQHYRDLNSRSQKGREKYYKSYWQNINGLNLNKVEFNLDKDAVVFEEKVAIKASNYIIKDGENLIFAPNAFNKYTWLPKRYRNRKLPFQISRGFLDEDEFEIHVPEGYKIEMNLKPVKLETPFGTYEMSLALNENNSIKYKRRFLMREGNFSNDQYNDYRNFIIQVNKLDNTKILLTKR